MKRRSEDPGTQGFVFRAVAITVGVLVSCSSFAAAPNWWSERGVLVPNASADDYALVNQGQLKNLAAAAAAEMDARVPAGAGDAVHDLIASWAQQSSQRNDFAPLNLGQLKNVAKPFYDQLITAGLAQSYPWAGGTPDDFALANIGQAKSLFSFELNIFGDRLATGMFSASLAIESTTSLWSWGAKPGDGANRARSYPLPLTNVANVISVSAGPQHAAFLESNGTVWTWGRNAEGELGDGTNIDQGVPTIVPNLSGAISVKTGGYHTLALLQDGSMLAWGEDYYGQLGNGQTEDLSAPVAVTGLANVRKIAAGDQRSVALKQDGTVWTWGFEHYDWQSGQDYYQLTPTLMQGLTDVIDIAAGIDHVVVVKSNGTVWAWGTSWNNEVGVGGPSGQYYPTPVQVPGLPNIVAVSAKSDHTLALASNGTVWAWGRNQSGQVGNGTTSQQSGPVQVSELTDVIAIAAAQSYSMAMKSDGTVWAWGQSTSALGQTMDGSSTLTPHQTVLGMVDQNNNDMDDRWEMDYFGNLDQVADGDFDGDGVSNFAEYSGQTDPTDYYNGSAPALSIVSGDSQTADPEAFLANPLVVQVLNQQGQPLANAPVTFTNGDGSFSLTNDDNSSLEYSLTVRTDSSGLASVYYFTPAIVNFTATITATAQTGAGSVTVEFTEMTDTPPPPEAPSDVTVTRQADGSTLITWVSNSMNEDGFVIERQNLDGNWDVLGYTGPGVTTFMLAPPTQPIADTRNDRVAAYKYDQKSYSPETNPASVRYAIIDLGTATPSRITNSGYALLRGWYPLHGPQRWYQGQVQDLVGGDEPLLASGSDINESGTVVGSILLHQPGSAPTSGVADCQYSVWYPDGNYGIRQAVKWEPNQTEATFLTQPTYGFEIYDCSNPHGPPYTGAAQFGSAWAIDNDGHTYGEAMLGYQEHQQTMEDDPTYFYPTHWGALYGGYDFTAGVGFGNQSLFFNGTTFVTQGSTRFVHRSRNGISIGNDNETTRFVGTIGYLNGAQVNFLPINVNSFGELLCTNLTSQPFDWFLYDTATAQIAHDLEIPAAVNMFVGPFFTPMALNHRQIPAYDDNGQPILDDQGQQTTKESPKVVGGDYTFSPWGDSSAVLWEENPQTHQYQSEYLDRLIPLSSGWQLENAYDINDDGLIACDGWYQPHDSNGNPTGPRQWKGALLLPNATVTINTFIPQNNVEDPLPFNGTLFKGDNRHGGSPDRATWNENGSHRTQQKFHVIADQSLDANGLVDDSYGPNADGRGNNDRYVDIGETKSFDPDTSLDVAGNLTAAALADTTPGAPLMIARATAPKTEVWIESTTYLGPKKLAILCRCEATNPIVSGSPAISYTVTITIDKAAGTYSIEGSHDGFPAYEIYINGSRVYQHDPLATGEGLGSLWPPEEHDVNEAMSHLDLPLP